LAKKESVSALAEEFGLPPSQIHLWVNTLLAQADKAFHRPSGTMRANKAPAQRIQQLEAKLATKNDVIAELLAKTSSQKRAWGTLNGRLVPHDTRDQVVDYVRYWTDRAETSAKTILR
jgi:hypothetical protein